MNPKVTVLMSVYNGEKYLKEAIDSIINQTFSDFEFLIIDDGSTDSSVDIIKSYNDHPINLIKNGKNIGISKSLNKGLHFARGKYIAIKDADDITIPYQFEIQVDFMEKNLDVGVCSAWLKTFGENRRVWKNPLKHEEIITKMFFSSPIWHPCVMIRKEVLDKSNVGYDESFHVSQDYKLWVDLSNYAKFANIPKILLLYRRHRFQISKLSNNSKLIRNIILEKFLGRPLTNSEKNCHETLFSSEFIHDEHIIKEIEAWVNYLKKINTIKKTYVEPLFSNLLDKLKGDFYIKYFYNTLSDYKRFTPRVLKILFFSKHKYYRNLPIYAFLKFCAKCILMWPNRKYKTN
jgi:glycosyltransferase involved in cell wall biosynthesis